MAETKTLGYISVDVLSDSPEWKGYSNPVDREDGMKAKESVRNLIKSMVPNIPEDAVIDFINAPRRRIKVFRVLNPKPKVARQYGTDLSKYFKK